MNEAGFNLIMNIMSGIQVFLYAACMTAFFYPFMAGKRNRGKAELKKRLWFLQFIWLCILLA